MELNERREKWAVPVILSTVQAKERNVEINKVKNVHVNKGTLSSSDLFLKLQQKK